MGIFNLPTDVQNNNKIIENENWTQYIWIENKWQDQLLGPTQGLEKTLPKENKLKTKIKYGHNGTKIGASNIFGGNKLGF